jgi:hypothetical protein
MCVPPPHPFPLPCLRLPLAVGFTRRPTICLGSNAWLNHLSDQGYTLCTSTACNFLGFLRWLMPSPCVLCVWCVVCVLSVCVVCVFVGCLCVGWLSVSWVVVYVLGGCLCVGWLSVCLVVVCVLGGSLCGGLRIGGVTINKYMFVIMENMITEIYCLVAQCVLLIQRDDTSANT